MLNQSFRVSSSTFFLCLLTSIASAQSPSPSPTESPSPSPSPSPGKTSVVTQQGILPPWALHKKHHNNDLAALIASLEAGIPLTAAQQQLLLGLNQTILHDLNAHLFRLRAGVHLRDDGAPGPNGPGDDGKEAKAPVAPEMPHWDIFTAGEFGSIDLNDEGRHPGYRSDAWAGTLGAEYHFDSHWTFGLAGSGAASGANLSQKIGHIDTAGANISAYGTAVWDNVYADLLYSFGIYDETSRRNTFMSNTAHGETTAYTNAIQFNTGYNIRAGDLRTGPFAGLDWVHADVDGYTESGGGNASLTVGSQHADSLISQIGWQASYAAHTSFGAVIPQVHASWDHEYMNTEGNTSATLAHSPYFSATGRLAQPGSDYLDLGAGVLVRFGERISCTLDYQTHLFQQRTTTNFASIKLEYTF